MSERQEGKPYYVDFRESGGVVHREPIKNFPEIVLTGRTKSELDSEFEKKIEMTRSTMGEASNKGRSIGKSRHIARSRLLELSLPNPGFIELEDNFYTGWFYTHENGQVFSAFGGKRDGIQISRTVSENGHGAYFLLDEVEAERWSDRLSNPNPLTVQELRRLLSFPGLEAHPMNGELNKLNLNDLTGRVSEEADGFWENFRKYDRDDKSDEKLDLLKSNLLNLEVLGRVHNESYKEARSEIGEIMKRSQVTVFPLGREGCMVRYIADSESGEERIRSFPIPHDRVNHFHRYGRLRQKPMIREEIEAQYRTLVDPNTKLQF